MTGIVNSTGARSGIIGTTVGGGIDYEEGTWTLVDDTAGIAFSSLVAETSYVKIGKMVFVSFRQTGGTINQTTVYQPLDGLPYPAVRAHAATKLMRHGNPYMMELMIIQDDLSSIVWTGYNNGTDVLAQTYGDYCFNLVYETSS